MNHLTGSSTIYNHLYRTQAARCSFRKCSPSSLGTSGNWLLRQLSCLNLAPSSHKRFVHVRSGSSLWSSSSTSSSVKTREQSNAKSKIVEQNDLEYCKLKELSYAIVQRSGTRDIVQRQFEIAKELCSSYYNTPPLQRFKYLCFLSDEFSTSFELATQASNSFLNTQNRDEPYDVALLVDRLRMQIRPRYLELFRYIARLDNGVKFLVDLRGDLITVLTNVSLLSQQKPSVKVYLRLLSTQLSDLLSLWFSAGFLKLERLTWDSPTSLLQKISEYEAVHPIVNWLDLKNRVGLYRRCYMFSHSCLPGEPLVILHVALVPNISSSIQEIIRKTSHQVLLNSGGRSSSSSSSSNSSSATSSSSGASFEDALSSPKDGAKQSTKADKPLNMSRSTEEGLSEDPNLIDAAVFYSISSTQKGLNGIDLGNQLIKQVASGLKAEFPLMSQFSSLSPIPNFTEYLLSTIQSIQRNDDGKNFISIWQKHGDFDAIKARVMGLGANDVAQFSEEQFWPRLIELLRSGEWVNDATLVEMLQSPLMHICAHYLYHEKRRGYALNSVANFHMKNGAVMWRLNWMADTSARGLASSCGMMVNYRYYLERYHENSQVYLKEKRIIAGEKFLNWL